MAIRKPNWMCSFCGAQEWVKLSYVDKKKVCSKPECKTWLFSDLFSGAGNPAFGKTYRTKATDPEWAALISQTHKASGRMLGDKNPMKRLDVAKRMSKTRREVVTSDPAYRQARSESMKQAWADGKYDDVKVGKCKWYDHIKLDGSLVKCQGTWEVAFARRLDELNVDYVTHRGRWPYDMHDGSKHNYYPDFYVPMWDAYIDVKGAFWNVEQHDKIECVRTSNPTKVLVLATKDVLRSWNVKVKETQDELLAT